MQGRVRPAGQGPRTLRGGVQGRQGEVVAARKARGGARKAARTRRGGWGGARPRNGQARLGQACAGPASGEGLEMRVRPGQVPHGQAAQGYLSDGRPWVPGRGTFIA